MISPDWTVRPNSRIAKLPRVLQPFALIAREATRTQFVLSNDANRLEKYHHRLDGIATVHNDGFRNSPRFRKAYDRAILAAGWDYGIPYRVHQALWCSRQAQKVEGDFVEVGTGRGFFMSAILEDFADWTTAARELHLFDTFLSTLPDDRGSQPTAGEPVPYYAKSKGDTQRNFAEWPHVHIHQGDIFETLGDLTSQHIALLHIDLNFWKPEIYVLRSLWPRIPRGGVVLLDDYAYTGHERQYDAMNALAGELRFDILSTPTGQGIIIK